jgi:phage-related baseplate assembly protein
MALVVEDGTGLSTAESYASVAAADTRLNLLGNDTWDTMTTAEQEEALRRSTTFMEQNFRARWQGSRVSSTQALSWPRYSVYVDGFSIASTTVPVDVANACIDLALKAAAGDLAPDIERAIIREKVGPLETEWSPHASQVVQYRAINMTLAPYLMPQQARVARA